MVVAAQLLEVHVLQPKTVVTLLRAPLHRSLRIDVQELEAPEAFPAPREISKQHLLHMLAVKIGAIENPIPLNQVEKLFTLDGDPSAPSVHDRKSEFKRKILG